MTFQPRFDFEAARGASLPEIDPDEALIVDIDGYEGPLHLLLELARRQKIDLLQISVTRLAEQYLAFVREAKRRRFALAADYLVMAAWLAYLKSRLLLPRPERAAPEELPAEEVAQALAFRLAKLDAMRGAVDALKARPQDGRDVFGRGDPQAAVVRASVTWEGDLHALVTAYVEQRRREQLRCYAPQRRVEAYSLEAARERLRALLPELAAWAPLSAVAPEPQGGPTRASCLASTLSAGLEMVKAEVLEARQAQAFAELYLRARKAA
ncbi:MAG: segregation/condensation protein A [Caulobacteraceae bacterium]|nr:segregation/condensation protein A [Caulobacter sp.]